MSLGPFPVVEKPFGHALAMLGERFPELVVVDADLQRATDTAEFRSRYPTRHWNVGVAEAKRIGFLNFTPAKFTLRSTI